MGKNLAIIPLKPEEIQAILTSSVVPLTANQRTLLRTFMETEEMVSVPAQEVGRILGIRGVHSGRSLPSPNRLNSSIRDTNNTLKTYPVYRVEIRSTSPNRSFFFIYRVIDAKERKKSDVPIAIQRKNVAHGLWACRELGCVIMACTRGDDDGDDPVGCFFERGYRALGGDPDEIGKERPT